MEITLFGPSDHCVILGTDFGRIKHRVIYIESISSERIGYFYRYNGNEYLKIPWEIRQDISYFHFQ